MEAERFCEIVNHVVKINGDENKVKCADTINLARLAYAFTIDIEETSFQEYLAGLNLSETEPLPPISKEEAIAKAENIRAQIKKQKENSK